MVFTYTQYVDAICLAIKKILTASYLQGGGHLLGKHWALG